MSKLGKKPIQIPKDTKVKTEDKKVQKKLPEKSKNIEIKKTSEKK